MKKVQHAESGGPVGAASLEMSQRLIIWSSVFDSDIKGLVGEMYNLGPV